MRRARCMRSRPSSCNAVNVKRLHERLMSSSQTSLYGIVPHPQRRNNAQAFCRALLLQIACHKHEPGNTRSFQATERSRLHCQWRSAHCQPGGEVPAGWWLPEAGSILNMMRQVICAILIVAGVGGAGAASCLLAMKFDGSSPTTTTRLADNSLG